MSGETLAHCFCQLPAPFTRNSPRWILSERLSGAHSAHQSAFIRGDEIAFYFLARTADASSASNSSVVSQLMHASVMLWP